MKLSPQEQNIIQFLIPKKEVYWEELAQFCKNPQTVKLKTIKKIISDLRKKFNEQNISIPFSCSFKLMLNKEEQKITKTKETVNFNGQTLVRVTFNKNNKTTKIESVETPLEIPKPSVLPKLDIKPEFTIKPYSRQVITRSGIYTLSEAEFEIFDYMHTNINRFISLEELRDKICYPKFGSKLPARWFSAIQRRIGNIRQHIPETRNKLLTAKLNNNSGYIFNL